MATWLPSDRCLLAPHGDVQVTSIVRRRIAKDTWEQQRSAATYVQAHIRGKQERAQAATRAAADVARTAAVEAAEAAEAKAAEAKAVAVQAVEAARTGVITQAEATRAAESAAAAAEDAEDARGQADDLEAGVAGATKPPYEPSRLEPSHLSMIAFPRLPSLH